MEQTLSRTLPSADAGNTPVRVLSSIFANFSVSVFVIKNFGVNFRVLDSHYAPILVSACEKFRYDYIHGLQGEWSRLFLLQWRNTRVEDALQQIMDRYVHLFIF